MLAVQADGCDVRTIEGLEPGPLQRSLPRAPRAPVRVLHRRHPDDARRLPGASTPTRPRTQLARGAGREPVPLHGLSPDHRGRAERDEAALPVRPRDPAARAARARRAGRRAALRARRHGDRRPPRHDAARLAGDRRDGAARPRSRSSTSSPTARRRRSRGCTAPGATDEAARARLAGAVARASGSACSCWRCSRSRAPAVVDLMGGEGEVERRRGALPADLRARRAAVHARQRRPGLPARRSATCARRCVILVVAHIVNVVPRAAVRLRLRLGPEGLRVGHGDRAGRDGAARSSPSSTARAWSVRIRTRCAR